MKNKGFTLVELIGVIVIIGVLAGIITAVITKNIFDSRQKLALNQEATITDASKSYLIDNPSAKDEKDSNGCFVTVGTLRDGGYLDEDLINPMTKKRYKASTCVVYSKEDGYSVNYVNEKGPNTNGKIEDTSEYNVKYNCTYNGGSICSYDYKAKEDELIDLSVKGEKKGWTFIGWNTNKHAKTALKKKYMGKKDITLYAIYRKDAVKLSAPFEVQNNESASASSDKATCTIKAVYNNETQGAECNAAVPTLNAKAGSVAVGWNTDKNAKNATKVNGDYIKLTIKDEPPHYYSITYYNPKKATFNVQDKLAVENTAETKTCTIYNLETKCTIIVPTITPRNGYIAYGWDSNKSETTATYKGGETITFERGTNNMEYYSITRWNTELKASFKANKSTLNGELNVGCYLYNGSDSCKVSTPKVTPPDTTPNFIGWNRDSKAKENESKYYTNDSNTNIGTLQLTRDNMGSDWYAITRKTINITATFYNNGTKIANSSTNCDLKLYNGMTEGELEDRSCQVFAPIVNKSDLPDNYDTLIGWNNDKSAIENNINSFSEGNRWKINLSIDNKTIKCNKARTNCYLEWYPITKKNAVILRAGFSGNNSTLDKSNTTEECTLKEVYNGAKQDTICTVTPPKVTPHNNTPNFVGWSTNNNSKTSDSAYNVKDNTLSLNESNTNNTWFAITKGETETLKANFELQKNAGLTASKTGEVSCTIDAPYNGAYRETNCTITSPTLTNSSGYTVVGWNTDKTSHESIVSPGSNVILNSGSPTPTYYSISYKTLGANFYPNGSIISDADSTGKAYRECNVYNGNDSCDITNMPAITRENFAILGYNKDKNARKAEYKVSGTLRLTSNLDLYAITKRDIAVSFSKEGYTDKINKMDNDTSTIVKKECTIWNIAETCSITTPTITPTENFSNENIWAWNFQNIVTNSYVNQNTKLDVNNNDTYKTNVRDVSTPTIIFDPDGYSYNQKWFATNTTKSDSNLPYIEVKISDTGVGLKENQEIYYGFNTSLSSYNGQWNLLDSSLITKNIDGSITAKIPTNTLGSGRYYLWIKNGICDLADNEITTDTKSKGEYDFDNNKPVIGKINATTSTNTLTAVISATALSGISKYEYSLDGINFVEGTEHYTFNDLVSNSDYTVYTRVTNKAGITSDIKSAVFKTKQLENVSIKLDRDNENHTAATITYPEGCGSTLKCKYIKDGIENTVTTPKVTVEFDTYGILTAEAKDEFNNISTTASAKITLSIENATVEISDTEFTYDGKAKTPSVTVKDKEKTLDTSMYSVNYLDSNEYKKFKENGSLEGVNNILPTDVGTYYIVIAGTNFYDSYADKVLSFNINKSDGFITLNKDKETVSISLTETKVVVTKHHGGTLTAKSDSSLIDLPVSDNTITVGGLDNIDPGKSVTITITSAATKNYKEASTTYVVTRDKKENNISLDTKEVTYNGKIQQTTARADSNETVSLEYYSDNLCTVKAEPINAGVYYAKGSSVETDTYKKGALKCSKAITISKAKPEIKLSSNDDEAKIGHSMNITMESSAEGAYTVETTSNDYITASIKENTLQVNCQNAGESTVKIRFTPNDNNNYNSVTTEYRIKVNAKTVTIKFEKGSGTESIGKSEERCTFKNLSDTCIVETPSIIAKKGYTVAGWNAMQDASTGTSPGNNITLNIQSPVTYYGISVPNTYTIKYKTNGGTLIDNTPTTAKYDSDVKIGTPSKTFVVNIDNKDDATLSSESVSKEQTFTGWTGSDLDANAMSNTDATPSDIWDGSETKNTYFKNLRSDTGNVTMTANWKTEDVTLPKVAKDGYTCSFIDDAGNAYNSEGKYTPSIYLGSVTLHTKCTSNEAKVVINKDDSKWNDSNVSVALYQDDKQIYTLNVSEGYGKANAVKAGEYDIYASTTPDSADLIDTGANIVINSSGTATINYYTLILNKDNHITNVNGEGIYLNGYTASIDANAENGYSFSQWQVDKGSTPLKSSIKNTKVNLNETTILTALSSDNESPVCSISATNELKKESQTITLRCTDNEGVVAYYFGDKQNDLVDDDYQKVDTNKEFTKDIDITKSGTYHLYAKDEKGNVSENKSITLYTYKIENKLTDSNDIVSSETYIAKSGTIIDIEQVYKMPSNSSFSYYTTGSSDVKYTTETQTLTDNTTYIVWFIKNT